MKKEIEKMVLGTLKEHFGSMFAEDLLKKIANDKTSAIVEECEKLVARLVTKSTSKSQIVKTYLVSSSTPNDENCSNSDKSETPKCEKSPTLNEDITAKVEKSRVTNQSDSSPELPNLGADLRGKSTQLTEGCKSC